MLSSISPAQPHRFIGWKHDGQARTITALTDALLTQLNPAEGAGFDLARDLLRRHLPMLPPAEVFTAQHAAVTAARHQRRQLSLHHSGDITVALASEVDQDLPPLGPLTLDMAQPGRVVWVRCDQNWREGVIERLYTTSRNQQRVLVRFADGRSISVEPGACAVACDSAELAA